MSISEKEALDNLVTLGVMTDNVAEIIQTLAQDRIRDVEQFEGETVRPLIFLLDKSGSMEPHKPAVIDGQHHLINSLLGASPANNVYLGQILFNHEADYFQDMTPLHDPLSKNHVAHANIKFLDESNYIPSGGTALYDTIVRAVSMLAPLLVGAEDLGQQVISHIAIVTDGLDEHSKTQAGTLKKVIDYVLDTGIINKIVLVGIGDFDYVTVGKSVGIEDVVNINGTEREMRRVMNIISSQAAGG
jgi:hypothetical protein